MTNTADMTPVEIDTFLSANYEQQMKLQFRIASQVQEIKRYEERLVRVTDQQHGAVPDHLRKLVSDANAHLAELQQQLRDVAAQASPYHVEYNSRPWNRYFLVKNTNGHVHRGMNCSTCFATTQYGWLVELADCDEDAMVEEWGEMACTVCFPSAPANPNFNRPSRRDREAQAARDAEKAAKAAAKAEKAITDVDGSELKIGTEVYRTKIAARNELSRQVQNGIWYAPNVEAIRKLAVALDAAGMDWNKVVTTAFKKATKEAVPNPANPYRLSEEQIAETQREIAANTEATREVLEDLVNWVGREGVGA